MGVAEPQLERVELSLTRRDARLRDGPCTNFSQRPQIRFKGLYKVPDPIFNISTSTFFAAFGLKKEPMASSLPLTFWKLTLYVHT